MPHADPGGGPPTREPAYPVNSRVKIADVIARYYEEHPGDRAAEEGDAEVAAAADANPKDEASKGRAPVAAGGAGAGYRSAHSKALAARLGTGKSYGAGGAATQRGGMRADERKTQAKGEGRGGGGGGSRGGRGSSARAPRSSTAAAAAAAARARRAAAATPRPEEAAVEHRSDDKSPGSRFNYFICVRICSSALRRAVARIQDHILGAEPRLAVAAEPLRKLHVTVLMVTLDTPVAVQRAIDVLQAAAPEVARLLPPTTELSFTGIDTFRDRVLYSAPAEPEASALRALHDELKARLRAVGIEAGDARRYTPHMTVMKLSRAERLPEEIERDGIDRALYAPLRSGVVGTSHLDGVHLCTAKSEVDDGFYERIVTISGVPASGSSRRIGEKDADASLVLPVASLLRHVSDQFRRGEMSSEERARIKDALLSGDAARIMSAADQLRARRSSGAAASGGAGSSSAPDSASLAPPPLTLLLRQTSDAARRGEISADEKASLKTQLLSGGGSSQTRRSVAHALEALRTSITAGNGTSGGVPATSTRSVGSTALIRDAGDRLVVILRGLPGSGKSTAARRLFGANRGSPVVCSADDFFVDSSGNYNFDATKLSEAHDECFRKFRDALRRGAPYVVVDNTNTTWREYERYIVGGRSAGYPVRVVQIDCPDKKTVRVFQERNAHGVPAAHCMRMWKRFTEDRRAIVVAPWRPGDEDGPPNIIRDGTAAPLASTEAENPVTYCGIFLTAESKEELLRRVPAMHKGVKADHMTIKFAPKLEHLRALPVGRRVTLRVAGAQANDRVQAVAVELADCDASVDVGAPRDSTNGLSANAVPHITLSVTHGASPVESNALLNENGYESLDETDGPLLVAGVVGCCLRPFRIIKSAIAMDHMLLPCAAEAPEVSHPVPQRAIGGAGGAAVVAQSHERPPVAENDHGGGGGGGAAADRNLSSGAEYPYPPLALPSVGGSSPSRITDLFLFDFDGTLFITPDKATSVDEFAQLTGHDWPHDGFIGTSASLAPPFQVHAGGALAAFRAHQGRAGSMTAIVTGRLGWTLPSLVAVCEQFGIAPDRIYPCSLGTDATDHKVSIIAKLLQEFRDVERVTFWEDREEALTRIEELDALYRRVSIRAVNAPQLVVHPTLQLDEQPLLQGDDVAEAKECSGASVLREFLRMDGRLRTASEREAAASAAWYISALWCDAVGVPQTEAPRDHSSRPLLAVCSAEDGSSSVTVRAAAPLVFSFGSQPLGRGGTDVDLCIVGPDTMAHPECIEALLRRIDGVCWTYSAPTARCPRLKVRVPTSTTDALDVDLAFALVPTAVMRDLAANGDASVDDWVEAVDPSDTASMASAYGVRITRQIARRMHSAGLNLRAAQTAVDGIAAVLRAGRHRGTAFACLRTFQIYQMVVATGRKLQRAGVDASADELFRATIESYAALSEGDLRQHLHGAKGRAGARPSDSIVPSGYVRAVSDVFTAAHALLQAASASGGSAAGTRALRNAIVAAGAHAPGAPHSRALPEWPSLAVFRALVLPEALLAAQDVHGASRSVQPRWQREWPLPGHVAVRLAFGCRRSAEHAWGLGSLIRARLTSHVRRLLHDGVVFVPGRESAPVYHTGAGAVDACSLTGTSRSFGGAAIKHGDSLVFAVQHSARAVAALEGMVRALSVEVQDLHTVALRRRSSASDTGDDAEPSCCPDFQLTPLPLWQ